MAKFSTNAIKETVLSWCHDQRFHQFLPDANTIVNTKNLIREGKIKRSWAEVREHDEYEWIGECVDEILEDNASMFDYVWLDEAAMNDIIYSGKTDTVVTARSFCWYGTEISDVRMVILTDSTDTKILAYFGNID